MNSEKHNENGLPFYFGKLCRLFKKHLKKTKSRFGVEDIHKLRVSVKKLRAFINLLEIASNGNFDKSKNLKTIDKLFSKAGKLREIQVNILLIKNYHNIIPKDFIKYLEKQEKVKSKRLKKTLENFKKQKFKKECGEIETFIKSLPGNDISAKCEDFISLKINIIRELKDDFTSIENIHEIRKAIRSISSIVDLLIDLNSNEKLKQEQYNLKASQDLIGQWHDRVILLTSIDKYEAKKEGKVEKLRDQINSENQDLIKKIQIEVDKLLLNFI